MTTENYRLLADLIATHPEQKVVGRTRLQKEVKLLQRLGFPTDYSYTLHFYGPYSEELQADISLLEAFQLVREEERLGQDNTRYYLLQAQPNANTGDSVPFQLTINRMASTPTVVLELAATYDAFREFGANHEEAMARLRRKKREKCTEPNVSQALGLLRSLSLPVE
ncbi:MAG: hypothetical protein ACOY3P_11760 [Planctomycetota bacterium]